MKPRIVFDPYWRLWTVSPESIRDLSFSPRELGVARQIAEDLNRKRIREDGWVMTIYGPVENKFK